jgi:hypothetical protein
VLLHLLRLALFGDGDDGDGRAEEDEGRASRRGGDGGGGDGNINHHGGGLRGVRAFYFDTSAPAAAAAGIVEERSAGEEAEEDEGQGERGGEAAAAAAAAPADGAARPPPPAADDDPRHSRHHHPPGDFREVAAFVRATDAAYDLRVEYLTDRDFKCGLERYCAGGVEGGEEGEGDGEGEEGEGEGEGATGRPRRRRRRAQRSKIAAILLGTRRGDPNAGGQDHFCPSSRGWPPFLRVNPVLDWAYGDVWRFLRAGGLPYCSLYDDGYTSLGSPGTTAPNAALRRADGSFAPAYALADGRLERQGRRGWSSGGGGGGGRQTQGEGQQQREQGEEEEEQQQQRQQPSSRDRAAALAVRVVLGAKDSASLDAAVDLIGRVLRERLGDVMVLGVERSGGGGG